MTLAMTIPAEFEKGFQQIRAELEVPQDFPQKVYEELKNNQPTTYERIDLTKLDFYAIDPEGAVDLDQAFYAEKTQTGYKIFYAIADVAAFVKPGSAIDSESHSRGVTLYSPDIRTPLHPPLISEDQASLLQETTKPALVWTIELDQSGFETIWKIERATVQIHKQISYKDAQKEIDSQKLEANHPLSLIKEIGLLRQNQEELRGGISVKLPGQHVVKTENGYELDFEKSLLIEGWNAQISLLTGMIAAKTLIEVGQGILRNLPRASNETLTTLRRSAKALSLRWPDNVTYADFVRSIEPTNPENIAFLNQATRSFRGAGYINIAEADEDKDNDITHNAIASVYAHVTAPLRRLVDRYNNEILISHFAQKPIPDWVTEQLSELPSTMGRTKQKASALERAVLDLSEAILLENRIDEVFLATVINKKNIRGKEYLIIQIAEPAIIAKLPTSEDNETDLGEVIRVKLKSVQIVTRNIEFEFV